MDRHGELAPTRLAAGVLSGTDAWSREARRVREIATRLGLALDEEVLALQDVHELQALHARMLRRTAIHKGKEDTMSLQGYGVTEGYDELVVAHQAGLRRGIAAQHVARQVEAGRRVGLFRHLVALIVRARRKQQPGSDGQRPRRRYTRLDALYDDLGEHPTFTRWTHTPIE